MGQVAGSGGSCCSCDQLTGCDCGNGRACSLICRSKASTAALCGFEEYTDPSDPPRQYRTQTLSGYNRTCHRHVGTCAPSSSSTDQFRGTYKYDRDTCAEVNTQAFDFYLSGAESCDQGDFDSTSGLPKDPLLPGSDPTTQTRRGGGGSTTCTLVLDLTATAELSDEDTEDDAEARAAALVADWSGCANCGSGCSAFRTDRTGTGLDYFGYRKVQTKCQWWAEIGANYQVRIDFARRLLGSAGPYLDLGQPYETLVSADVNAESTDWVDVPNEAGWETIASGCSVTLVP